MRTAGTRRRSLPKIQPGPSPGGFRRRSGPGGRVRRRAGGRLSLPSSSGPSPPVLAGAAQASGGLPPFWIDRL